MAFTEPVWQICEDFVMWDDNLAIAQAEKAHERQPILDLELRLVVRQAVEGLQNHDPEHHHRVVRRPTPLRAIRVLQRLGERLAKNLLCHHRVQLLQRITMCRDGEVIRGVQLHCS